MVLSAFRAVAIPAVALVVLAACSANTDNSADTAAGGTVSAATSATGDTAGASHGGMDHSTMVRSAPRDTNQVFLRMMSDHHQGLFVMIDSAGGKLSAAKADADMMRQKQKSGQEHMVHLLATQYSDSIMPMVMPSNQPMIEAVARSAASNADRVFYQQVIAHHREGIMMIDKQLPYLTREPKQMATTMRAEQQREITEFERKAGGSGSTP